MISKKDDHSAFVEVGPVQDFPSGEGKRVDVEGRKVAVFHVRGQYFALHDECTHARAPLSRGVIRGTSVHCPHHGAQFDLQTGVVLTLQATRNVEIFDVKVVGDRLFVSREGRVAEPMWVSGRRFDQDAPAAGECTFTACSKTECQ